MDQLAAHQGAQDLFAEVLISVGPDQLRLPTPCTEWDATALIDHVIDGNEWVLKLVEQPRVTRPDDLVAAHAASASAAHAVFAAPDGLTRIYPLWFGALPGSAFIDFRIADVFTHAWDLAVATGQSTDFDPELAAAALAAAEARIEPAYRGGRRPFGAIQPCPDGRTSADQVAAFLGRPVA